LNNWNFLQIFPHYKKFKDSGAGCINLLYDFTNGLGNGDSSILDEIESIKPIKNNYTIKLKDGYIQYVNDNHTLTFKIENEFVKETDELNTLGLPYFKWKYTLVDNCRLPNISRKDYDFYYQNVDFSIYKINENKLFIIEVINNVSKKYILEKIQN
jgi:hypothetical protein